MANVVVHPSSDLFAFLDRDADQIQDANVFRRIVTAFVLGRIASERLAIQIAEHESPVTQYATARVESPGGFLARNAPAKARPGGRGAE